MLALLQEARREALNRLLRIVRESADLTQVRLAAQAILRIKPDPEEPPPEPAEPPLPPPIVALRAHAALADQLAKLTSALRKAKEAGPAPVTFPGGSTIPQATPPPSVPVGRPAG